MLAFELHCDRPGCTPRVAACAPYDELAQRRLHERARDEGWQLAKSADVPLDFCARHREPA